MRLMSKVALRLFLAFLILSVPQIALATSGGWNVDGDGLSNIVDNMSEGTLYNLLTGMSLAGCFNRDSNGLNPS